jgi:hypothetical protein
MALQLRQPAAIGGAGSLVGALALHTIQFLTAPSAEHTRPAAQAEDLSEDYYEGGSFGDVFDDVSDCNYSRDIVFRFALPENLEFVGGLLGGASLSATALWLRFLVQRILELVGLLRSLVSDHRRPRHLPRPLFD